MLNVLFICTCNSARSIIAEALLNALGEDRFRAYSAGTHAGLRLNPFVVQQLISKGHDTSALKSKNWDRFSAPSAPPIHLLITLCAYAEQESCPINMENGIKAHWEIEDPTITQGSVEMKRLAFESIYRQIREKVAALVDIPLDKLEKPTAKRVLRRIGAM